MTFFAVLIALLLDQAWRPGPEAAWIRPLQTWAAWVQRQFDAGRAAHGWLVWATAIAGPVLGTALIYGLLARVSGLFAFAWTVVVLYATAGFRQFSYHFTAIRAALESGDEVRARALFAQWQGDDPIDWPREELLRRVIVHAIVLAHRYVLGVLVWFVVLAALGFGPAGAVMYRAADWLAQTWAEARRNGDTVGAPLARLSSRAWYWIDAVSIRATVLVFAIVGHFEDALERWRQQRQPWHEPSDGLLVSVAEGALQVRLCLRSDGDEAARADLPQPQLVHLASVVGLVWRSVMAWLLLLALVLLARIF